MPNPKKLKAIMADRGMTQQRLADEIGSEVTYVNKMCNNRTNAKENTLIALSKALGCKIDDLVGGDE